MKEVLGGKFTEFQNSIRIFKRFIIWRKFIKKDINKVMPILQALAEGKTIQFAATDKEWVDLDGNKDGLSFETLINNPQSYRIKPKSEFRPFKDAEECWQEMEKHKYFGWIKCKDTSVPSKFMIINSVRNEEVSITSGIDFTYSELIEYYTFVDGTPFGIKVKE